MKKIELSLVILIFLPLIAVGQRKFIHPGITYTQSDIDRMKAMVQAYREPFYSTFQKLKASEFSQNTVGAHTNVTQIKETQFNNYIGMDGRKAHDNALMWRITDDKAYADNAVRILNRYLNLTNASSRGTGPLDNGKIYMLIEAAELMRDYAGWKAADQNKFRQMLVYPGYSTKVVPASHFSVSDSLNGVSFYWNIYNFDRYRYGNQGLFAARGLMAMGIYLDNDTIYDRAYRYLMGLPHRSDDLPYQTGPAIKVDKIKESDYKIDYKTTYLDQTADYGYDELLKYYIFQNGQCQESSRDQIHVLAGIGNYTCIAEMAWNQGDSLYNALNNRILKGIEYNLRYNMSVDTVHKYEDQPQPWEPAGYSTNESECSFDNGTYYQFMSRSGRWYSKKISPEGRTSDFGPGGWREQALAHYKTRMGVAAENTKWLQRSHDRLIADYGYENMGYRTHLYEWSGWGTLTKRRTEWMAGEPVTFINGQKTLRMPTAPCQIQAVDYDYFCGNGEGHTYHDVDLKTNTVYRTDGTPEIAKDGANYILTNLKSGEWFSYSLIFPATVGNQSSAVVRRFRIYVTYKSIRTDVNLSVAVDNGTKTGVLLISSNRWVEKCVGELSVSCGADVMRFFVEGKPSRLCLKTIRIEAL